MMLKNLIMIGHFLLITIIIIIITIILNLN